MRIITTLIGILNYGILLAQTPGPNELYKKIVNYYQQNPDRLEYVQRVHKNVFRFDTVITSFSYLPLGDKGFYLFYTDSTFSVTSGILFSDNYYVVNANVPEKILTKKKYLSSSFLYVPAPHCNSMFNLLTRFGIAKSVTRNNNKYIAVTSKGFLEIDTLTFRVTKLSETVYFKKKYHQYDEFYYLELPASIQKSIREQALTLLEAAKDFPIVTLKDLDKRNSPKEILEGKQFEFKNLISFNKGTVDSIINGKYVIFDFFYQACLPCHKMTGYILDWLPKVDTSKIVLVGVNPADSEGSMKMEIENRKINYPIIIGKQAKEIAHRYVQEGYPNLLLVSPDGTILEHHIGMSKNFLTKAEKIMSQ